MIQPVDPFTARRLLLWLHEHENAAVFIAAVLVGIAAAHIAELWQ